MPHIYKLLHPKLTRPRAKWHGVASIEMAIVLPLLVLILIGIVVFGQLMWSYDALSKATRDAARFLSTEKPIDTAAKNAATTLVVEAADKAAVRNLLSNNVIIECSPDCNAPTNVKVAISYDLPIAWGISVLHLSPETTMPYMG